MNKPFVPVKNTAPPIEVTIRQNANGALQITHNITKPTFLVGILLLAAQQANNEAVKADSMLIDLNGPPRTPSLPEPDPDGKVS